MPKDSILSWVLLTILSYGSVIHFVIKGFEKKEKYKRDSDRF